MIAKLPQHPLRRATICPINTHSPCASNEMYQHRPSSPRSKHFHYVLRYIHNIHTYKKATCIGSFPLEPLLYPPSMKQAYIQKEAFWHVHGQLICLTAHKSRSSRWPQPTLVAYWLGFVKHQPCQIGVALSIITPSLLQAHKATFHPWYLSTPNSHRRLKLPPNLFVVSRSE